MAINIGAELKKYSDRKKKQYGYRPRPPMAIVEGNGTPPFNRLSPPAVWVLLKLYSKFNGLNRNDLSLTYGEASEVISERVYNRCLWELRAFGFVEVVRPGCLERIFTIFALSNRWRRSLDPASQPHLDRIAGILQEIEDLKREKWPEGRKSEKRQRIAALRKSLFEDDNARLLATSN